MTLALINVIILVLLNKNLHSKIITRVRNAKTWIGSFCRFTLDKTEEKYQEQKKSWIKK